MSEKRSSPKGKRVGAQRVSTSGIGFQSRQARVDRITSTANSPQILVAFPLEGNVVCHAFHSDSAEEQSELERRLKLIQSGLDVLAALWKDGGTRPTE